MCLIETVCSGLHGSMCFLYLLQVLGARRCRDHGKCENRMSVLLRHPIRALAGLVFRPTKFPSLRNFSTRLFIGPPELGHPPVKTVLSGTGITKGKTRKLDAIARANQPNGHKPQRVYGYPWRPVARSQRASGTERASNATFEVVLLYH